MIVRGIEIPVHLQHLSKEVLISLIEIFKPRK